MLRKIFALSLFLPLACVNTARDNSADPGNPQHDAGGGVIDTGQAVDSGVVAAEDAGKVDAGRIDSGSIEPGTDGCSDDNLLPCYIKYRAADPRCDRGMCTVGGTVIKDLTTSNNLDARTACAVACNPDKQPGLCAFNFDGNRIDFATCPQVGQPSTQCPDVLEPSGDTDQANHGVCRIPCDRDSSQEESACVLRNMNDADNDGNFIFSENCGDDSRCGNTGRPGG